MWRQHGLGIEFYQSAFPTISALRCNLSTVLPQGYWVSALSLTETSISYEDNGESTVMPPEQGGSASMPTIPPTANPNPTSNAVSNLPVLPFPVATPSTARQESTDLQSSSVLASNSPVATLPSTHQEKSTDATATSTIPLDSDITGLDFTRVKPSEGSLTSSAVAVASFPATTDSLVSEIASAQPSTRTSNDNATPIFESRNSPNQPALSSSIEPTSSPVSTGGSSDSAI